MDPGALIGKRWRLVVPEGMHQRLTDHLFPGDRDEHGAVIVAGLHARADGVVRLLARDLVLARDGIDYVQGKRGYRMLKAEFIQKQILRCRDERLVYLAVHNHGPGTTVGFSDDDRASHRRGYPALLDVAGGPPVGALVFATQAVAGEVWLSAETQVPLVATEVIGRRRRVLTPEPAPRLMILDPRYDRQVRLFGDAGQEILRASKVGIIGVGGVGSLVAEYLGHLGVGHFVIIDPDRIAPSNLPRVVGARRWDTLAWLRHPVLGGALVTFADRFSTPKTRIARRVVRRANPKARVQALTGGVQEASNAAALLECDYVFLAADTMTARLIFNQIVHQYYIPGVQIGSKVTTDKVTGNVANVFSVVRPVTPETGCLWCNQLINRAKLQEEAQSSEERQAQRYIDEPEVIAPNVITLNAVGAAHAVNDFLFYMTGLTSDQAQSGFMRHLPQERRTWFDQPRKDQHCPECGKQPGSRLARGSARGLATTN